MKLVTLDALGKESLYHVSFYAFWILCYMHCIIMKNKVKMNINQPIKMQKCFFRSLLSTGKKMNKSYSTAIFLIVKV